MLDSLMPNTGIFKSPANWFLVAFSVLLLSFVTHLLFQQKEA